jgi:glycosyltransferase involved in cell wall biosynthesis
MPKNILYILPVSERGGAERIVESWASHHSDRYRAHVIVPAEGALADSLRALEIRTIVPPQFRIRTLFKAVKFLSEYIKSESIDLIHSTMPKAHLFGGLAAMRTGCAEIWFHHGPMQRRRYQGVIPLIPSAAVLVASHYMVAAQTPTYYAAKAIRRVPCGIDTDALTPNAEYRKTLRRRFNLDDRTMAIGMFGRLIEWKGQHVLIEALRIARARNADFRFRCFLVGGTLFGREPEYQFRLRKQIEAAGLIKQVVFTGHLTDVYPYYDMMDAVIHASTVPEPFGLVVSEAMAKQKVVIAAGGGGPSEMIADGQSGFLYPAGDATCLAAVLADIYERWRDPAGREGVEFVAQQARASISREYSIERSVTELETVYGDVLNGRN